jgi:hypothetical protein
MARENQYIPAYPETIQEAIQILDLMHDEDSSDTDFMNGYRMGLRIGINQLKVLERRL